MKTFMMACAALVCATPAAAAIYTFNVSGTITSQNGTSQNGPGTYPGLSVGDTVTVSAKVDSRYVLEWGNYGYSVAAAYWNSDFMVKAGGVTWISSDDISDAEPTAYIYNYYLDADGNYTGENYVTMSNPAFLFSGHKVSGLAGTLYRDNGATPDLELGSSTGTGSIDREIYSDGTVNILDQTFTPGWSSSSFTIQSSSYGDSYDSPYYSFTGVWDFAGSTVTVPEPATWALMIVGFGLTGTMLRRGRMTGSRLARVTA